MFDVYLLIHFFLIFFQVKALLRATEDDRDSLQNRLKVEVESRHELEGKK